MATSSVFNLSEVLDTVDGMVVGPAWTDDRCRELLRSLRMVSPAAPDAPDADEQDTDVLVAARVFHEVLSLTPASVQWPVFSGASPRHSLFKAAVTHALSPGELTALSRLSDASALLAANVARWMLQLRQQTSVAVVFTPPPRAGAPRTRTRYATAREVAVAC